MVAAAGGEEVDKHNVVFCGVLVRGPDPSARARASFQSRARLLQPLQRGRVLPGEPCTMVQTPQSLL